MSLKFNAKFFIKCDALRKDSQIFVYQNFYQIQDIQSTLKVFSKSIQIIGERLHELISDLTGENDIMVCAYQQLSNFLLRMAQQWSNRQSSMNSEILEPFQLFMANFRATNRHISAEGKQSIKEIEQQREQLLKSQSNYWKLMANAEKGTNIVERVVDEVDRGSKSKDDLMKASERSVKLKEVAQEAQQDYKKLVEITNKKWDSFESKWDEMFQQASLNEESRFRFSRQTIWSLIRLIGNSKLIQFYEEKQQEIEQKAKEQNQVNLRQYTERLLKKRIVQNQKEDFVSFDQMKKQETQDPTILGGWQLIGDSINENERNVLDTFINILLNSDKQIGYPFELMKYVDVQQQDSESEDDSDVRQRASSSSSNSSRNSQQLLIYLKQIMNKQSARNYFIDVLTKEFQYSKLSYINLSDECYNDLIHIMKKLVTQIDMGEQPEYDEIYKVLVLCTRMVRKSSGSNIAGQLYNLDLWQKQQFWQNLFMYLQNKQKEEKKTKIEILSKSSNPVLKGIGFLGRGIKKIKGLGQQQQQEQQQYQLLYLTLEELNLFLMNLQLKTQLATEVIINLGGAQLDRNLLMQLLEKLEDSNAQHLRKKFLSGQLLKQHREKKYQIQSRHAYYIKLIFSFKKSLKFIDTEPERLLLVSKTLNQRLKSHVARYYLNIANEDNRIHYFRVFLRVHSDLDYVGMKMKVGIDMDTHMQQIEEIISMDVQRSLHIHQQSISSNILQSLLRTYAYFNREVSYCQGMNYLAGYLYLNFHDEELTYRGFDYIMEIYFSKLFVKDFELMKVKFYQFEKLFALFLPKLADHFKQEKVDASYYLPPWMITLFTQVYQYTLKSEFLHIIWDIFLSEQWKGFFKVTLFILYYHQEQLIKMRFDEILHFLSELIKCELFQMPTYKDLIELIQDHLGQDIKSLKEFIRTQHQVNNSLLRYLENEYQCFITNFSERVKRK